MQIALKILAWLVLVPAAIGAVVSAVVAVLSWAGQFDKLVNHEFVLPLLVGMLWAVFLAMPLAHQLSRGTLKRNMWKVAMRGAPAPVRWAAYGAAAYLLLVWAVGIGQAYFSGDNSINEGRYFSAFALALCTGAVAVAISALRLPPDQLSPTCPNGHRAPAEAKFCVECGEEIALHSRRHVS